jgi:hypothetical protein
MSKKRFRRRVVPAVEPVSPFAPCNTHRKRFTVPQHAKFLIVIYGSRIVSVSNRRRILNSRDSERRHDQPHANKSHVTLLAVPIGRSLP